MTRVGLKVLTDTVYMYECCLYALKAGCSYVPVTGTPKIVLAANLELLHLTILGRRLQVEMCLTSLLPMPMQGADSAGTS